MATIKSIGKAVASDSSDLLKTLKTKTLFAMLMTLALFNAGHAQEKISEIDKVFSF